MVDIYVRVDKRGPIFSQRADDVVDDFLHEAVQEIGDMGVRVLRMEFDRVLRHQTGYYVSNLDTMHGAGDLLIHDNDVIYGAWLEGVGSRNKSTRFKGYFTFRRMTQVIDARAGPLANRLFRLKYLRRLQ